MELPTIVIPTYTNTQGLGRLLQQLSYYEGHVVVVDNKPDHDKKHMVRHTLKNGAYLPQERNVGFAAGVNIGATQAHTKWFVIMNDDIVLPDLNFIGQMIQKAEEKGWVAATPLLADQSGKIENCGYTVLPIGKVELNFDQSKITGDELDGITAACMLMKKSAFDDLCGFDPNFFAYLEDVDLCLRMKKKWYRFGVDTSITVIHEHQQTSSQMGWFKERQDLINWVRIIAKNWDKKMMFKYLFGIGLERLRNASGLAKKILRTLFVA